MPAEAHAVCRVTIQYEQEEREVVYEPGGEEELQERGIEEEGMEAIPEQRTRQETEAAIDG